MDDLQDLKRCPFCGTVAVVDEIESITWRGGKSKPLTKYIARCLNRKCAGHHNKSYVSEKTAIDMWNMRVGVDPEIIVAEVRKLLVEKGVIMDE